MNDSMKGINPSNTAVTNEGKEGTEKAQPLTLSLTVGDVWNLIKSGKTPNMLVSELGVSVSAIQRRLKKHGFSYDNSAKVWSFEFGEPLPEDLAKTPFLETSKSNSADNKSNTKKTLKTPGNKRSNIDKKSNNKELVQISTDYDSSNNNEKYSNTDSNEIKAMYGELYEEMREVISWYKELTGEERLSLHERTKLLDNETEKIRRTFVITPETDELINDMAKKERLAKSDILAIAVKDLFTKYNRYNK